MEIWPHWGSFWLGVLAAFVVPGCALILLAAVIAAIQDLRHTWRNRRAANALLREAQPAGRKTA